MPEHPMPQPDQGSDQTDYNELLVSAQNTQEQDVERARVMAEAADAKQTEAQRYENSGAFEHAYAGDRLAENPVIAANSDMSAENFLAAQQNGHTDKERAAAAQQEADRLSDVAGLEYDLAQPVREPDPARAEAMAHASKTTEEAARMWDAKVAAELQRQAPGPAKSFKDKAELAREVADDQAEAAGRRFDQDETRRELNPARAEAMAYRSRALEEEAQALERTAKDVFKDHDPVDQTKAATVGRISEVRAHHERQSADAAAEAAGKDYDAHRRFEQEARALKDDDV